MNCPKCKNREMKRETWEGTEIERCPRCRGMFLDPGELERMLLSQEAEGADSPEFSAISDKHDMVTGYCHRCGKEMEPYMGPRNMRLDRCPECGGVFLDQGELAEMRAR